MNVIAFLFSILLKFLPTQSQNLNRLKVQADEWYQKFIHGTPEEGTTENEYVALAKQHVDAWYTQTGLAVLYFFALKAVHDYLNGVGDDDEEEEEDDDE